MRGDAEAKIGGQGARGIGDARIEALEFTDVAAEAQLAALQGASVEPALAVEHGQMREADPALLARREDRARGFGHVVIMPAADAVVEIVELGRGAVSGFGHFELHQRGHCLDMLGREDVEEAVHDLPPGPEIVGARGPARFGQPRHRALEAVRVHIGEPGEQRAHRRSRIEAARRDLRDQARIVDMHRLVGAPACGREDLPCRDDASHSPLRLSLIMCIHNRRTRSHARA